MSSLSLSLLSLVLACSPEGADGAAWSGPDVTEVELGTSEEPAYRTASPIVLSIDQLVPGDRTRFVVEGASPYETVHLARSTSGLGLGPCLGTLQGLCLDVRSQVTLHATGVADASGEVVLTQTIPEFVPIGADVQFQAVIPRGTTGLSWVKSNAIELPVADAPLVTATMVPGDLVVSEVMSDPAAVADVDGEWFEIYNPSGLDVNADGLTLTNGVQSVTLSGTHFIGAGERVVVGREDDESLNGGVPVGWELPTFALADDFGEIHLMVGSTVIDSVAWDDGTAFPAVSGVSMEFHAITDDNDLGSSWTLATLPFGAGDLGTPGESGAPLSEMFEDGDWDGWIETLTDQTATVEPFGAGGTDSALRIDGGPDRQYEGLTWEFAGETPREISFYVRTDGLTGDRGYVVWGAGGSAGMAAHFRLDEGDLRDEGAGPWPLTVDTWHHVQYLIDWPNAQYDYLIDGQLVGDDVPFHTPATELWELQIYNYSSDATAWWDEIMVIP